MNKKTKIIVITAIVLFLLIASFAIFTLWWNGAFENVIVYDIDGNIKNSADTFINDDGGPAHEKNIKSIEWKDDSVKIILQASEMQDKEIIIAFNK